MSIIYLLIPIAILFTAIGIFLFLWAVKTEQFDDLEKQGLSILFEEKITHEQQKDRQHSTDKDDDTAAKFNSIRKTDKNKNAISSTKPINNKPLQ